VWPFRLPYRRCPRDGSRLRLAEAVIRGSSLDAGGLSRPAIIERTYSCPQCDFRHVEAVLDPTHRAASVRVDAGLADGQWRFYHLTETLKRERAGAGTEAEFQRQLADAKLRAAEKTSPDSPWRR